MRLWDPVTGFFSPGVGSQVILGAFGVSVHSRHPLTQGSPAQHPAPRPYPEPQTGMRSVDCYAPDGTEGGEQQMSKRSFICISIFAATLQC